MTKATGFAEGLFEGDFTNARAIQGKAMKMEYLDKIVLCVGIALGRPVNVRTNKVVAGLEPENTNIFLQDLGTAATDKSLDFADIVRRTLNGEQPGASGGRSEAVDEGKSAEKAAQREKAAAEEAEERRKQEEREASQKQETPAPAGGAGELDVNGDWERTAELVGALISKPSMKQKLLSRLACFRFIADTVLNISKATGFLDGLYSSVSAADVLLSLSRLCSPCVQLARGIVFV